jgi:hypothetical protein
LSSLFTTEELQMRDTLKSVGVVALGIGVLVGLLFLAMVLLKGTAFVSAWAYPLLVKLFTYTTLFAIPVLILLAIPRGTRPFAGMGLFIASYVFGVTMWVWAFLLTLMLWGWLAVIVGVMMAGVGVVPIALLATALNGMWSVFGQLLLGLVMTFGCRAAGFYVLGKSSQKESRLSLDVRSP